MGNRINIDRDWKFFLGDLAPQRETDGWGGAKARAYSFGAVSAELDDSKWRNVNIPHDFVIEGDYTKKQTENSDMQKIPEMESIDSRHLAGGSLEGGIAWYRKHFILNKDCNNKRIYICFDGIYRNSTVYLNEYFIGTHSSGYTSFYYDITDFVNFEEENVLAVRVDATGREGWWYEGGGIYRHVWLEAKNNVRIAPDGVYVSSDVDVANKSAVVKIQTEVSSKMTEAADITVKSIIIDKSGTEVASVSSKIKTEVWSDAVCSQNVLLENINLWNLDNPYLYSLKTNIYIDNKLIDYEMTSFGIRHTEFKPDSGFYLNGKHVRIQGLCCHHDHAGVGIGVPDSVQEYRIKQMLSMGANAYRTAHYPPTRELLDICDRLGMLVFDETRRMSSAPSDIECLKSMVKRDRNHPSIFLWGIGNEEIFSQDRPETARATVTMKMEVQKLDNTRPITSAVVCWNGKERFENARSYIPVTRNLDIMGFNYCRTAWDDYHERMPEQPMIITEASSNSGTRGCYSTDEEKGHYYILDTENSKKCKNSKKSIKKDIAETEWKYFAERPYLSGIFLWTGIDYRGEPTPLTYPAVYSQFGILDYCGFRKDNFYYYKSWWSDEDVLHVFPHWNYVGQDFVNVHCYSNFDEVELLVNDVSYGKKSMEKNWYLTWDNVKYEVGELVAVGYRNGIAVKREVVKTTKNPYAIELEAYENTVHSGDTAIVNVRITDEDGLVVPTADNEITFTVEGDGEFLGVGNGNPGSHEFDKVPVRRAFNGLCQLLVTAGSKGKIKVTATSAGIKSGSCTIDIK